MSLVINETINKAQYAAGFNQGMEQSAETFSLMIQILVLTFAFKVIVKFPWIANRLEESTHYDIIEVAELSADVLAFFVTVMMYWSLLGKNLLG